MHDRQPVRKSARDRSGGPRFRWAIRFKIGGAAWSSILSSRSSSITAHACLVRPMLSPCGAGLSGSACRSSAATGRAAERLRPEGPSGPVTWSRELYSQPRLHPCFQATSGREWCRAFSVCWGVPWQLHLLSSGDSWSHRENSCRRPLDRDSTDSARSPPNTRSMTSTARVDGKGASDVDTCGRPSSRRHGRAGRLCARGARPGRTARWRRCDELAWTDRIDAGREADRFQLVADVRQVPRGAARGRKYQSGSPRPTQVRRRTWSRLHATLGSEHLASPVPARPMVRSSCCSARSSTSRALPPCRRTARRTVSVPVVEVHGSPNTARALPRVGAP